MLVKKGQYVVIADVVNLGQKSPDGEQAPSGGGVTITKETPDMEDIPLVGQETPGVGTTSDLGGKQIKTKASEFKGAGKSKIFTGSRDKVKTNWKKVGADALSRASSSISDKVKRLIQSLEKDKPLVDWKKELKKFFDRSLSQFKEVLPKRRFAGSGLFLRGQKRGGDSTFKTVVAAVDTSGSISQEQSRTFITEVMHLCKIFDADVTYIIYCSDDIGINGKGGIDIVKKGQKPDFSKWVTTGGNNKGFIPPFDWVEKNNIKPSVFIYLTDTGGEMPDPNKYGISKYKDRVVWFLCGKHIYNQPPFGKIMWAPKKVLD